MSSLQEVLSCFICQLGNGAAHLQELGFGLAYQFHEDFTLSSALAAKATHDLLQLFFKVLCLALQRGGSGGALLGDVRDELEDFF